jgi:hypothetical protein
MALSIFILSSSNKQLWSEWTFLGVPGVQPQVWVSAFSTLSGALLSFAFIEGVAVNFWTRATAGTTVCWMFPLEVVLMLSATLC